MTNRLCPEWILCRNSNCTHRSPHKAEHLCDGTAYCFSRGANLHLTYKPLCLAIKRPGRRRANGRCGQ